MARYRKSPIEKWSATVEREFLDAYEANTDVLFRHVLLRVRDRERAKDIVQEAFSRTWMYLSKGKKIEHIKAFLFRVANNLIVDASRRKQSSSLDTMMEEDGYEVVDESITDPADIQGVRDVLKLLASLDEMYRIVITLRYIDEMSPGEIARVLGVTENVVSVRIYRGIERLKALFNRVKDQP